MTDRAITIRRLRPDDKDLKTVAAELNSADSEISIKDFTEESLQKFVSDPGRHYVVAYRDGVLAGAAHAYNHLHPTGVIYLYIDEVDTFVGHRRQGVATVLMKELFQIGVEQGADEVWLGTEHDNIAANALYTSLHPSEVDNGPIYSYKIPR